jgi:dTDP-4-amino-4,6-dideoxygalactose transaminase
MKVPLLDLKSQYRSIKNKIDAKMQEVVASQMFILGKEVEALEKELADYSGVCDAVGVTSGSDALIVSLMALGIGSGDKVISTPFTFFATAGAIVRTGAVPVFCDIDPETYNLDPTALAETLDQAKKEDRSAGIKAVLPVHLYGQMTDMDPIMDSARRFELSVIEDACQAVGSEYPSREGVRKSCVMGDMGTLSFFPSKNLGGFGDGGMVLTNRSGLAARIRKLRNHGAADRYFYDEIGGNFRLDALQAAVLRIKLRHLDDWQQRRRERAETYNHLFEAAGLIEKERIKPPAEVYRESGIKQYHTYHQYVIRAKKRDKLQDFLQKNGIGTSIYYPLPLHMQKCFAYLGYKEGDFPASEKAAREVLALPVYAELNDIQQQYIVEKIAEFYNKI